jgi:flagellar motor switch protein FliN/FliY
MNTRSENSASKTKGETASGRPIISADSPIFKDARVVLNAALGQAELSVQEILALKAGSVVELDTQLNGMVELWLNGAQVARGEIVAVEGHFGVRIVEIAQL